MVLKSAMPTRQQIGFWDKYVIPVSRITDAVTAPLFGRTLIMVLQKA